MREFTLEDVTYDKSLDKKYNFLTILDEINIEIDKEMTKQLSAIHPKFTAYLKENLIATRANKLLDGDKSCNKR